MTPQDVTALRRCIDAGGVAIFPADTVYGLACDPDSPGAVRRLYEIKSRAPGKPAAVMFFEIGAALAALSPPPRTEAALRSLLPGPVTVVLPNPRGLFPLAGADDPASLGVRVPRFEGPLGPLSGVGRPVLQSSANPAGAPDPRRLPDVDPAIRAGADLALDGGELPGTPSTVVDLGAYEETGAWTVVREGAAPRDALERALSSVGR